MQSPHTSSPPRRARWSATAARESRQPFAKKCEMEFSPTSPPYDSRNRSNYRCDLAIAISNIITIIAIAITIIIAIAITIIITIIAITIHHYHRHRITLTACSPTSWP